MTVTDNYEKSKAEIKMPGSYNLTPRWLIGLNVKQEAMPVTRYRGATWWSKGQEKEKGEGLLMEHGEKIIKVLQLTFFQDPNLQRLRDLQSLKVDEHQFLQILRDIPQ